MSAFLYHIKALYKTDYLRRTKNCSYCKSDFCDISKRNLGSYCSKQCTNKAMVETRHNNGSYVVTIEQRKARSIAVHEMLKSEKGIEVRKKISNSVSLAFEERGDEIKAKQAKARVGKIHWTQTDEGRKKCGEILNRNPPSVKTRQRMSVSAQQRLKTKRQSLYTSANGGTREDLGMYFRSNWEANFARILNFQGKSWEYEPTSFQLENSVSYTPDFKVNDEFFELKGRMDERSMIQIELFKKLYPDLKLTIIGPSDYNVLRKEFKNLIPSWEGK